MSYLILAIIKDHVVFSIPTWGQLFNPLRAWNERPMDIVQKNKSHALSLMMSLAAAKICADVKYVSKDWSVGRC